MEAIFNRDDLPDHLFNIPELDFSEDLFVEPLRGPWFKLGAIAIQSQPNSHGVASQIERQCFMLAPGHFSRIYDELEAVGNVIENLGKPTSFLLSEGQRKVYSYAPFHRFDLSLNSVPCEPLVFVRPLSAGNELFVNPDLELYFELEKKSSGIWWDPRRGVEVLRHSVSEGDNLQIVEIRVDHLKKYLQVRQLSLVVGHYRHLRLFDPSRETIEAFVKKDVVHGSPAKGAKAIFQNWGLNKHIQEQIFLWRRLHLWFEIKPLEIDINDPWAEEPPFDPYEFTLPTPNGPVAPARWKHFREDEGREFEGGSCDYMARIYFKQEVLSKYEGVSGFKIFDDGSMSCRNYWGLDNRSTARFGNELLSTTIGDFAMGIPFDEWPHWKQYAVEPPSLETLSALREEQTIPNAVNSLVENLNALNATFADFTNLVDVEVSDQLWCGSLESLAGRQLKGVYTSTSDDDEFLKRATLLSTLVIDGFKPRALRKLLQAWGKDFHRNDQGKSLASRKLLERLTLIALLIGDLQPERAEISTLVKQAEAQSTSNGDSDLESELRSCYQKIRDELAQMAFLYELRTHGGLAHLPNKPKVAKAAVKLGLPEKNWHRTDYLRLLDHVARSVRQINNYLVTACRVYRP